MQLSRDRCAGINQRNFLTHNLFNQGPHQWVMRTAKHDGIGPRIQQWSEIILQQTPGFICCNFTALYAFHQAGATLSDHSYALPIAFQQCGKLRALERAHCGQHANHAGLGSCGGGLDRGTFEARAKALKLLPDGAIETINDWGFDRFDEPVLEGDEDLTSPEHLRLQLLALDLAA